MGQLGSPKPEKRQANSPLPPTPKSGPTTASNATAIGNATSLIVVGGHTPVASSTRNSVASEQQQQYAANSRHVSRENLSASVDSSAGLFAQQPRSQSRLSMVSVTTTTTTAGDGGADDLSASASAASKKRNSAAKNLEGMYAKVMKKNKLSNAPSQNTSPIPYRKSYNDQITLIEANSVQQHHHQSPYQQHQQPQLPPPPPPAMTLPPVPTVDSVTSALTRSMYLGGGGIDGSGTNDYETISEQHKRRPTPHHQHAKDPEYETIPADAAAVQALQQQQQLHKRMSSSGSSSAAASSAGISCYTSSVVH